MRDSLNINKDKHLYLRRASQSFADRDGLLQVSLYEEYGVFGIV